MDLTPRISDQTVRQVNPARRSMGNRLLQRVTLRQQAQCVPYVLDMPDAGVSCMLDISDGCVSHV
jgi:hypothetical protein